ncbi:MAG: hypothetical protein HQL69_11065 [Magnetococcales bacterium]|nr:hypothetical protein [Magnetococcales bacterium]
MYDKAKKIGLVIALMTIPTTSLAGSEVGGFDLSANVAMTTDYVWRGVSQTSEGPAVQGGFDLSHKSGFYLGTWGSNVDFGDSQMEFDLYGGYATEVAGGLGLDLGVIQYYYPGGPGSKEYDFTEFYLGLSYSVADIGLSTKYSYSSDFGASTSDDSAQYIEVGVDYTMGPVTAAAHYGYSYGDAFTTPDSYSDYSFGLSTELKGLGLDISYYGTNDDGETLFSDNADDRVVFTVSKSM